jgi:hypothetical protein
MLDLLREICGEIRQLFTISSAILLFVVMVGICYVSYSGMLSRLVRSTREEQIRNRERNDLSLREQLKISSSREKLLRQKYEALLEIKKEKNLQLENQRKIMEENQRQSLRMEKINEELQIISNIIDKKINPKKK